MTTNTPTRRSSACTKGFHKDCVKKNGTECPCHAYYKALDDYNNQVITQVATMPIKSRVNYTQTVARLAPIYEEIRKQVFLDSGIRFDIVGATVRDALWGQLVDKYIIQHDIDEKYAPFVDKHVDTFLVNGEYVINTKFGNIKLEFQSNEVVYNWSCDSYRYNLTSGIYGGNTQQLEKNNILSLIAKNNIDNPQVVLQQGIEYAKLFGWTISQGDIEYLAREIEKNKPLENTHELIVGFRAYNIKDGNLMGHGNYSHGQGWPSEKASVDCPDFRQHIKSVQADWRYREANGGRGDEHDCGIYVYKDPTECLFHYGKTEGMTGAIALVVCWGDFGEFERGYRVEHCRIERLWIWDKNNRLTEGKYNIESIVLGARFNDFLYDPQVMQYADRIDHDEQVN